MKGKLLAICDQLKAVVDRRAVEYGADIASRLDELKAGIENYVFRVYVVGPFSCGKSSLLNRWLGEDLLLTGLTPETAVSTELRYGEEDHVELYTLANPNRVDETLRGTIAENMVHIRNRANRQEIANVVCYKNNPRLKEYRDICLVDMPGLSSNNPSHDAALKRLAQEPQRVGVFCCQIGHFDETCLEFVKTMSAFGKLKVLLTQADTKPQSEHAECISHVCGQIHEKIGRDVECGVVSIESGDDFIRILDSYRSQKDRFLLNRFGLAIREFARELEKPLCRAVKMRLDTSASEDAMAKLAEAESVIPEMICDAEQNLRASLCSAAGEVASRVRAAAIDQQSACAGGGQDAVNRLKSVVEATISLAVPRLVQRAVKDTNVQAEAFMDDRLNIDPSEECDLDVVAPVGGDLRSGSASSETRGGELINWFVGNLTGNFTPLQYGLMEIGSAFGPVGIILGSAASFLLAFKMDEEKERGRQEAENRQNVEQMVVQVRPAIEESLQKTCDRYLDELRNTANNRIGVLREQMLQLKAEAKEEEEVWRTKQQIRSQELETISAILMELETLHG